MRRLRVSSVEDLLLSQVAPGFFFAVAWTVMYEIYHEDGSYYTTLIQEILGSDGLFPYFLFLAVLMALPVGMVLDGVRHVVGEVWLGLPRTRPGERRATSPLRWIATLEGFPPDFERRYGLYRHASALLFAPAKASGNMALVLLTLTIWFVIKIIRMQGWHIFSPAFIIGTPIAGLALAVMLLIRYATGLREFHRSVQEFIFPPKSPASTEPVKETPPPLP